MRKKSSPQQTGRPYLGDRCMVHVTVPADLLRAMEQRSHQHGYRWLSDYITTVFAQAVGQGVPAYVLANKQRSEKDGVLSKLPTGPVEGTHKKINLRISVGLREALELRSWQLGYHIRNDYCVALLAKDLGRPVPEHVQSRMHVPIQEELLAG